MNVSKLEGWARATTTVYTYVLQQLITFGYILLVDMHDGYQRGLRIDIFSMATWQAHHSASKRLIYKKDSSDLLSQRFARLSQVLVEGALTGVRRPLTNRRTLQGDILHSAYIDVSSVIVLFQIVGDMSYRMSQKFLNRPRPCAISSR